MMERIPESLELMDDAHQAHAYATADLSSVNNAIVTAFREDFPKFSGRDVLELGCGAADVMVRFAQAHPAVTMVGVDGAPSMLEFGRMRVQREGLAERIELRNAHLPFRYPGHRRFDAVIANSVLHHLSNPVEFWRSLPSLAKPGAPVLVVDLIRPQDPEVAHAIVQKFAARANPMVQADFFDSLCAAYRMEEVCGQLEEAELPEMRVAVINEFQFKAWGNVRQVSSSEHEAE